MSAIIQELVELIRNNDVPNTERLRQHNIQIGLRDDQGAGVFVGVTNKGSAVGYERILLAVRPTTETCLFTGLRAGTS
jgi:hypothetical protein